MTLYRAICHNEANICLDKLGVCWSLAYKSAYPYGNKTLLPSYYIYIAEVSMEDVDTEKTAAANAEWPHEMEVVMKPNSTVQVTEIHRLKKPCQTLIEIIPIIYTTKT